MESTERRFAHLLQPIRELTKNWDMDVAAELNDYLEELDEMCITLDEGKTQLNFAEAALLIQGSTCIYSKKVELLHNLVFQTLDYIRDRKHKRGQGAAARDDNGDAAAARRDDNSDDDFCELDIEAPGWVDRPEVGVPVKVVPLPPASLLPPESRHKHKFPLISAKGEVVWSQKDFRINIFLPGLQDLIYLTLPSTASAPLQDAGVVDFATGSHEMADDPEGSFLPADGAMEAQQDVDEHVERQQGPGERRRQVPPKDRAAPPACNIWALYDAYAMPEEKPFKSGKAHKVPAGLDDGGKRKRQAAPPLQDFWTWFKQTYDPPERKLRRGPTCIDLNYIYQSSLKSKLSNLKRTNGKEFGTHAVDEDLMRRLLEVEDAEAQGKQQDPADGFEADEDEDNHEQETSEAGGVDASPEVELSYKDLVRLRVVGDDITPHTNGECVTRARAPLGGDGEELSRLRAADGLVPPRPGVGGPAPSQTPSAGGVSGVPDPRVRRQDRVGVGRRGPAPRLLVHRARLGRLGSLPVPAGVSASGQRVHGGHRRRGGSGGQRGLDGLDSARRRRPLPSKSSLLRLLPVTTATESSGLRREKCVRVSGLRASVGKDLGGRVPRGTLDPMRTVWKARNTRILFFCSVKSFTVNKHVLTKLVKSLQFLFSDLIEGVCSRQVL
ncbi:condensin-2 complex subunit H2 isoform X2 [Hippocampus comes]|uniref:condensin-2 complex subunit H2 isoform X2 n=1 Tax=Hippocampus comes TaxID=109280 RepID=UPI00094E2781|nr:PREDICTED: condensin-2 complex subunit H2 isoform X2 [Hippocampus comes]